MLQNHYLIAGLVLALSFATAAPVGAQATSPAAGNRMNDAWEDLAETEGSLLGNPQFVQLTNLAYQTAVVRVCDSHTLDKELIGKALEKVLAGTAEQKLTQEQQDERTAAILISFGARYGLFIAEGHADKDAFCEAAAKLKDSSDGLPLFLK